MVKITLFGLGGSGTSTIAKLFCKKNNYTFMSSGNIFREMANDKKMDVYQFNKWAETHSQKVDFELDKKVEKFGQKNNNFIFESRLAWHFIPDSIKIKIFCEFEKRCQRIQKRDGGNIEIIKEKNIKREKSELKRYKKCYKIENYSDDKHFDLIINSTNLTPQEIVNKIEKFIKN